MLDDIIWKDIPGFEGLYQCNQFGEVKNTNKGNILKKLNRNDGYFQYTLSKNGKRHSVKVHRIVATLFVNNPNDYNIVNHKDGNKQNNYYKNLEWCTSQDNNAHAWKNGLNRNTTKQKEAARKTISTAREVSVQKRKRQVICCETAEVFESITEAAEKLNLNHTKISAVCHGKRKTTGGYTFKFL